MKPFKLLRGRSILLSVPKKKESLIELSVKDEETLMKETMRLWTRISVYAIGDTVESVKEEDKVYVRTSALETAEKIDIDGDIKLLVSEGDIILIW